MDKQQTIAITQFKGHCLEYMELSRVQKVEWVITKHGVPIARVLPYEDETPEFVFGGLKDTCVIKGDIMAPIDVDWHVDAH